jgi:hypothetical protein
VGVSQAAVEIAGTLDVGAGFGGGEAVEENTVVSAVLEGAAVVAGTVERAGVQEHEERKAGADSR